MLTVNVRSRNCGHFLSMMNSGHQLVDKCPVEVFVFFIKNDVPRTFTEPSHKTVFDSLVLWQDSSQLASEIDVFVLNTKIR